MPRRMMLSDLMGVPNVIARTEDDDILEKLDFLDRVLGGLTQERTGSSGLESIMLGGRPEWSTDFRTSAGEPEDWDWLFSPPASRQTKVHERTDGGHGG